MKRDFQDPRIPGYIVTLIWTQEQRAVLSFDFLPRHFFSPLYFLFFDVFPGRLTRLTSNLPGRAFKSLPCCTPTFVVKLLPWQHAIFPRNQHDFSGSKHAWKSWNYAKNLRPGNGSNILLGYCVNLKKKTGSTTPPPFFFCKAALVTKIYPKLEVYVTAQEEEKKKSENKSCNWWR